MSDSEKTEALIQLAGAVAHELNNIFTAVAGNLSLLDDYVVQAGASKEMIGEVVRTAQRGIELSTKLQAFAGRQPLRRKRIDVNRVVCEVGLTLGEQLSKAIKLSVVPAPRVCPSFSDEDKLRDSIFELARNASAAMDGKGELFIIVDRKTVLADNPQRLRPGAYIRVTVTDTGPGMKPEIAARALDPMFSTKSSHINVGWGLSNCAGFLRQSGGTMRITSKLGRGTSIEVLLPEDIATHAAGRQQPGKRIGTHQDA
ncbi:MAG: ATP-binding protein [Rhizomicrobium sp.]|jgi:signal transduction histidine kinase